MYLGGREVSSWEYAVNLVSKFKIFHLSLVFMNQFNSYTSNAASPSLIPRLHCFYNQCTGYMPLIAYVTCILCGWADGTPNEKVWAITLVLQGCTPGGSSSNLYTYFSKGDLPLSVCMTITSTCLAFVMLPRLLMFYTYLLDGEGQSTMKVAEVIKR